MNLKKYNIIIHLKAFVLTTGIEDSVSLDLVVMGSVAVSKEGYRIGKGKGEWIKIS